MSHVAIAWQILAPVAAAAVGWASWRVAGRLAPAPVGDPRRWELAVLILGDLAVAALAVALVPEPGACLATLGLGWSLVLLAWIDLVAFRLPDVLTLPLGLVGVVLGPWALRAPIADHVIGALAGYAALAAVGWTYERLRGRPGLGLGDAKLLGAAGAWLGWMALPTVVVLASAAGLMGVGLSVLAGRRLAAAARIPFGPALAVAFWAVWLWGLARPAAL